MNKSFPVFFKPFLVLASGIIWLGACSNPTPPLALRTKIGMTKKEVERLIGNPLYRGGFVASLDTSVEYVPQPDRYFIMQVYPDSSLVVLKKDTVYERYAKVGVFKKKLEALAARRARENRNQRSQAPSQETAK